jgi:hypothetical protein
VPLGPNGPKGATTCSPSRPQAPPVDSGLSADGISRTVVHTLDGAPVEPREAVTRLLDLTLPTDNVLGAPAGEAQSVGHAWVALLRRLRVGTHTIQHVVTGTDIFDNTVDLTVTATIVVQPKADDDDDHGDEGDDDDGDDDDSRLT